jgi:signal transduction histidine kinase
MIRPWPIALVFTLALAVVLAALGWTSATVIRLDAAESLARRQAAFEEDVRLALWRMDSVAAQLVAQEAARPFAAFQSATSTDPADSRGNDANPDRSSKPQSPNGVTCTLSPLLTSPSAHVLLYFQFGPDGQFGSPQAPCGEYRDAALAANVPPEALDQADSRLNALCDSLDRDALVAALPAPVESIGDFPFAVAEPQSTSANPPFQGRRGIGRVDQRAKGVNEYQVRANYVAQNSANPLAQGVTTTEPMTPNEPAMGGLMTPLWLGDRLLLARCVITHGQIYVQGCWLDWRAIEARLIDQVRDLLPDASLVASPPGAEPTRLLAALPVRLVPGNPPPEMDAGPSVLFVSLAVAWSCVVLAALAVAVLLAGVVTLSERRAAFVSAVTHELRTPLTTFRMYAEMLAEGMVPDAAQRQRYLATLSHEAERLTHLVENVLAYARLERGRACRRVEPIAVADLLAQVARRPGERAGQAGMSVVVEIAEPAKQILVRTDASAVEQILFNLVDNACKYAAAANDRRIHVIVEDRGATVALQLADHGPGIAPAQARRLFRPFSKSAVEAANSAPGVGLGLALSRRLARQMGGDLRLECSPAFATSFALALPVAGRP